MKIVYLLVKFFEHRRTQKEKRIRQARWRMQWNTYFQTGEIR